MKNLFLTGKINIGKTTVLNSIIEKLNIRSNRICGFSTKAFLENGKVKGFYIDPVKYYLEIPKLDERIIGYMDEGKWIGVAETFDNFRIEILDYCL